MKKKRKHRLLPCGLETYHTMDGTEYDCSYPSEIECDNCIINGGHMSPVSGKPFRGDRRPYVKAAKAWFKTKLRSCQKDSSTANTLGKVESEHHA